MEKITVWGNFWLETVKIILKCIKIKVFFRWGLGWSLATQPVLGGEKSVLGVSLHAHVWMLLMSFISKFVPTDFVFLLFGKYIKYAVLLL